MILNINIDELNKVKSVEEIYNNPIYYKLWNNIIDCTISFNDKHIESLKNHHLKQYGFNLNMSEKEIDKHKRLYDLLHKLKKIFIKYNNNIFKKKVENDNNTINKDEETADIIIMLAGETTAKKIKIKPDDKIVTDKWFPQNNVPYGLDRIEVYTTEHKTGINDYYQVVYDGHNNGSINLTASWLSKIIGVSPTGNFIICHYIWNDEAEKLEKSNIDLNLKELKKLFKRD
jgi:hypothetical protein